MCPDLFINNCNSWKRYQFLASLTDLFTTIDVLLKAVGDTPIMKTKKWSVERGRTVQSLAQFISRFLKLEPSEQLCFGSDGKLVLHYCKSQAWG
ncbi:Ubiquitin-like protein ATG12 [Anabarilius grahami]|uniref:Ubiquitin-like protein ATG12 n=1 Tax=Anabarilius grahami TaxID=495550 RepID=A0A3N0XIG0_ANAGA|nr:Ubiquitin-like protein ATG12 [Anabarilius grahami]